MFLHRAKCSGTRNVMEYWQMFCSVITILKSLTKDNCSKSNFQCLHINFDQCQAARTSEGNCRVLHTGKKLFLSACLTYNSVFVVIPLALPNVLPHYKNIPLALVLYSTRIYTVLSSVILLKIMSIRYVNLVEFETKLLAC